MTYLTLVLLLASGEQTRTAMPSWKCYQAAAEMHLAWHAGGHVTRDDGIRVTGADCVPATIEEIHSIESDGPCEVTS